MKNIKRLDLLLREVQDPVAQENFWRLRRVVEELTTDSPALNFNSIAQAPDIASSTDTPIKGLSYKNSSGAAMKVSVDFSGEIEINTVGQTLSVSFYINGTQVPHSLRRTKGELVSVYTNAKVTIPSGQTLEVRASVSSGDITIAACSLRVIKCKEL